MGMAARPAEFMRVRVVIVVGGSEDVDGVAVISVYSPREESCDMPVTEVWYAMSPPWDWKEPSR